MYKQNVAPHVGAWIETHLSLIRGLYSLVAPHVGAWIETEIEMKLAAKNKVAPHVGAWIETMPSNLLTSQSVGRASRRRVD